MVTEIREGKLNAEEFVVHELLLGDVIVPRFGWISPEISKRCTAQVHITITLRDNIALMVNRKLFKYPKPGTVNFLVLETYIYVIRS